MYKYEIVPNFEKQKRTVEICKHLVFKMNKIYLFHWPLPYINIITIAHHRCHNPISFKYIHLLPTHGILVGNSHNALNIKTYIHTSTTTLSWLNLKINVYQFPSSFSHRGHECMMCNFLRFYCCNDEAPILTFCCYEYHK